MNLEGHGHQRKLINVNDTMGLKVYGFNQLLQRKKIIWALLFPLHYFEEIEEII